jgi:hypothetical protein
VPESEIELFLDDQSISWEQNVERRLCRPSKCAEPIVVSQHSWEQVYVTVYGSVLPKEDGSGFRMWYMAGAKGMQKQQFMCYAESDDGIEWRKVMSPAHPYEDRAETNIVLGAEANVHGPCVIRNEHNDDPDERYLAFYDSYWYNRPEIKETIQDMRWCYTATSPDGITWSPAKGRPAVPGKSDVGQSVIWDPERKAYLAYMRGSRHDAGSGQGRYVRLACSDDFLHWSEPVELLRADGIDGDPRHQLHQFSATRRGSQFVGLRSIFEIDGFETLEYEDEGLKTIEQGTCETQLAVSRDGLHWHCCADRQVFLPRGAAGQWDSQWIVTASNIVFSKDRMLFYYGGGREPRGTRNHEGVLSIGLATSPRDRFGELRPRRHVEQAIIETKPLPFADGDLKINADARHGTISAELCDFDGQTVQGFSRDECVAVQADGLDMVVRWKKGRLSDAIDRSKVLQGSLRIRFYLDNASLFAAYWPLRRDGDG